MTVLPLSPNEGSTYVVQFAFYDHAGSAVVPNAGLAWTLKDGRGNVVNSREDVAIDSAAVVSVVLSGNDLLIGSGAGASTRFLQMKGTYDSDAGSDLPIIDQARFQIANMI